MGRIVATHRVLPPTREAASAAGMTLDAPTEERFTPSELETLLPNAEALMVFMPDRVDAAVLDAAPKLRIVAGALKGYDNLDVDACAERGIWLTYVPDHLTEATAELALTLALGLLRRVGPGDRVVRAGDFAGWRPILYGSTLVGARVGIVGMGLVGAAAARRFQALGSTVVGCDPHVPEAHEDDLDALLASCDVIVLAAPLLPETEGLLDADAIARMRPGAYLVNVARGSIVDEAAVAAALADGHLAGYAADVFAVEDRSRPDRPRSIPAALLEQHDKTLFTPHLGSAVHDVRVAIEGDALASILDALGGTAPRNALNRP